MGSATRRRQVDIFNFSFLDILACVIGLLIFILTVVVISGGINTATRKLQSGPAISDLENKVRTARRYADAASNRRREAEKKLDVVAGEIGSTPVPMDAAARIKSLNAEILQLQKMLAENQHEKGQLENQSLEIDTAFAAQNTLTTLQQETARLMQSTVELQNRTKELTAGPPKATDITYYVPRYRPTQKRQSWLEVSAGKVWRIHSDDYSKTRTGDDSTYVRSPLAKGTTVESIVKSHTIPLESGIEGLAPDQVVITCVVRPDAYEDYRRIRDVAWGKGYSVHWIPLDETERIVLTLGGGVEQ